VVDIRAAVLTVSDTRGKDDDVSGKRLAELLWETGATIVESLIVSDELEPLRNTLYSLAEREDINLIITTGGTGLGPRDNTPEATRGVLDREAPGIAEAIRRETAVKTPMAMLSRGLAGTRHRTLIINLPGSPKAVEECFEIIRPVLTHAIVLLTGQTGHDR
jgi:molybdenum cofactor synthesis domain-containing protein